MYQQYQMTTDEDTLSMLKRSLQQVGLQSLDGKQSFEDQFNLFKKATQTLNKVISNHRGQIEFAKTKRMQWKYQLESKQATISQLQSTIREKDKQIQELEEQLKNAQFKFKGLYSEFKMIISECKAMESSIDHIEFSFLDEKQEIKFSEFEDYYKLILQENCEKSVSYQLSSLQSADYQGRERESDYNFRIAFQNRQKMRENMKKTRRMIISGVCSSILKDILIKIMNADGMTEERMDKIASPEQIYPLLDKQMDEKMGMKRNKLSFEKYLLLNNYALSNSLQNYDNKMVGWTSEQKKCRKLSES